MLLKILLTDVLVFLVSLLLWGIAISAEGVLFDMGIDNNIVNKILGILTVVTFFIAVGICCFLGISFIWFGGSNV